MLKSPTRIEVESCRFLAKTTGDNLSPALFTHWAMQPGRGGFCAMPTKNAADVSQKGLPREIDLII